MLPAAIRRLSYNPTARTLAQQLHIGHLARRLYCRFLSGNGKLSISCLGTSAVFSTHNAKQLAFVDCVVTTERDVIEQTLWTLNPGNTFLDVGCHYGIYSILASRRVGRAGHVIAVEPHPPTLEILRENLALNCCENVEVLNCAFSDQNGFLALSYNDNGSHRQRSSDLPSTVHVVSAMAGDDALHDLPVPAGIKIDVEGHEFAVLSGLKSTLSKASCRVLCVEIHPPVLPPGVDTDRILSFIRSCGFNSLEPHSRASMVNRSAGAEETLVIARR